MQPTYASPTQSLAIGQFMSKVYLWMTGGILLTAMISMWFISNEEMMYSIMSNKMYFYGLIIAEFALVIWISAGINKMNAMVATLSFMTYAALNGITLSVFAYVYTQESIASAFFTTSMGFAGLSAFGYFTKKDLGPVKSFCTMGLFGLIGFSILSIFFPSMMGSTTSKIYGLVGIIVFAGLTAYDTQKIKSLAYTGRDAEATQKGAIMGALTLYLDFINLFLFILRMSGDRRR